MATALTTRPERRAAAWLWWMAAVLALMALLYGETARRMAAQWAADPDYNHGFLVLPLAVYFAWERREALARLELAPNPWGAVLMATGLGQLLLGVLGAELFLQRSSLVVTVAGLILLTLGPAHLRMLQFPIAFLFFMVPLPAIVMNAVAFPLQLFAARTAALCLYSVGIPVLREGNVIVLAQTRLEVAEACSGIRSLQALMTLAAVYGQVTQPVAWKRWTLFAASVPIAIAANALRVSGTGILAHFIGARAADGFYHAFAGWSVFVVAFGLLLACGGLLARIGPRPSSGQVGAAA